MSILYEFTVKTNKWFKMFVYNIDVKDNTNENCVFIKSVTTAGCIVFPSKFIITLLNEHFAFVIRPRSYKLSQTP